MLKIPKMITVVAVVILSILLIITGELFGPYVLSVNGPLTRLPANDWGVVVTPILGIGFLAGFLVYTRLGSRAGGVVTIPLAVVESLAYPLIIPFLIIGSILSYIIGMIIFEEFLIYGRRLFYVFLVVSIVLMKGPIVSTIPHAFNFSTILPGIIAYNMHVEKSMTRSSAIVFISFAALYLLGLFIINIYKVSFYA